MAMGHGVIKPDEVLRSESESFVRNSCEQSSWWPKARLAPQEVTTDARRHIKSGDNFVPYGGTGDGIHLPPPFQAGADNYGAWGSRTHVVTNRLSGGTQLIGAPLNWVPGSRRFKTASSRWCTRPTRAERRPFMVVVMALKGKNLHMVAPSLNGSQGSATFTDDLDNEDRKRREKECDTNKHRSTTPHKSKSGERKIKIPKAQTPCRFWGLGTCKFGDKCPYAHDPALANKAPRPKKTKPEEVKAQDTPNFVIKAQDGFWSMLIKDRDDELNDKYRGTRNVTLKRDSFLALDDHYDDTDQKALGWCLLNRIIKQSAIVYYRPGNPLWSRSYVWTDAVEAGYANRRHDDFKEWKARTVQARKRAFVRGKIVCTLIVWRRYSYVTAPVAEVRGCVGRATGRQFHVARDLIEERLCAIYAAENLFMRPVWPVLPDWIVARGDVEKRNWANFWVMRRAFEDAECERLRQIGRIRNQFKGIRLRQLGPYLDNLRAKQRVDERKHECVTIMCHRDEDEFCKLFTYPVRWWNTLAFNKLTIIEPEIMLGPLSTMWTAHQITLHRHQVSVFGAENAVLRGYHYNATKLVTVDAKLALYLYNENCGSNVIDGHLMNRMVGMAAREQPATSNRHLLRLEHTAQYVWQMLAVAKEARLGVATVSSERVPHRTWS